MDNHSDHALKAGQRAIEKLIEEHRKSGEPMVISPSRTSFNGSSRKPMGR